MPPKTPSSENEQNNSILTLCHLMSTCTEFKPDMSAMQEVLGLAQAKNVPRKINSIINPLGFELKLGKIIEKEDNVDSPATPTKGAKTGVLKNSTPKLPAAAKTPSKGKKTNGATNGTESKKSARNPAASKKRKIETVDADSDGEVDEDASDATKDAKNKNKAEAEAESSGSDDAADGEADGQQKKAKKSADKEADDKIKNGDDED